jgi:hypothetical protein
MNANRANAECGAGNAEWFEQRAQRKRSETADCADNADVEPPFAAASEAMLETESIGNQLGR